MATKIDTTLQQQSKTGPPRELQIVDGKEIRIIIGNKPKQQAYSVQLLALADKSYIRLHIMWRWLWLFAGCILALIGYWVVRSVFELSLGLYEFSYVAGFSLLAILAMVMFFLKLARKRVFVSRLARVRLFDILISNPNQCAYKAFLANINKSLSKVRQFWNLKPQHQVAGEMRMLRRLAEEGIIRQADYEQAKKKLFSLSSK